MSALITALEEFDGRDKAALLAALDEDLTRDEHGYLVFSLSHRDGRRSRGAAFVLRTLLEKKRPQGIDFAAVFAHLGVEQDWSTRYHLLQCVQSAPATAIPHVEAVRGLLDHDRTALRVGALDAFVHIATVEPRWLPEALTRLKAATEDSYPSLRSRSAHLVHKLQKLDLL